MFHDLLQVIGLTWDSFDLEPQTNSKCRYDYVALYNGFKQPGDKAIGKYCGYSLPASVVSTGNVVTVVFVSDVVGTFSGFKLGYQALSEEGRSFIPGRPLPPSG